MSLIKGVTLGQYIPADSFIHKLDPRCKLLITVLSMILIFMSGSFSAMAMWAFLIIFIAKRSQIPAKALIKSAKPLLVLIIFTSLLNIFFTGGSNIIFSIGPMKATVEGTVTAFRMGMRLYLLVLFTALLLSPPVLPNFLTVWKLLLVLHAFWFSCSLGGNDDDDSLKIYSDSVLKDREDHKCAGLKRGRFYERRPHKKSQSIHTCSDTSFCSCVQTCRHTCFRNGGKVLQRRKGQGKDVSAYMGKC